MDWLTQMNEALDYIESHLTDEIDLDEIGRITACPAGLFQRIFPKIIGIPLSEYIRRRKLIGGAVEDGALVLQLTAQLQGMIFKYLTVRWWMLR